MYIGHESLISNYGTFIFFSDELASEALYSSWKPFMETNESNKMKLVIETANQGGQSSEISEHILVE